MAVLLGRDKGTACNTGTSRSTTLVDVKKNQRLDVSYSVTVSSLGNFVRWLSANNSYLLKKEFMTIGEVNQFTRQEAFYHYNRAKNRYNCVTYDHSRVKLQSTGEDGSDYINASWMTGEGGRENAYIAAQAPLRGTVSDMWRMVWEYRIEVVLMLTTLTEDGTEKCVQYWPKVVGGFLCVGSSRPGIELKVTLKTTEVHRHWQHSTITVQEMEGTSNQVLTVHHYHFTDWPDRGVPSSPASLLHLLDHIHTTHPTSVTSADCPPLLVHCSAGIGRTGTLLALDRLLQQLQSGTKTVNVLQTVRDLRSSRPGMVQNVEQYKFIYSCLEHVKTHRPTEIKPSLADPPTTTPTNSPPSSESSSNDIPVTPSEH